MYMMLVKVFVTKYEYLNQMAAIYAWGKELTVYALKLTYSPCIGLPCLAVGGVMLADRQGFNGKYIRCMYK